ncbi:MAG TPA: ABC transporter ATP-binding protein [Acidimicrobiia bacterium]
MPVAVRAVDALKVYGEGQNEVIALNHVDLEIAQGRFTAIMGPSGCGKSTLLHCLAGLDSLTSGKVMVGETDLGGLDDDELTRLRRDRIGFVFQAYNLLPMLTAAENIRLPMTIAGREPDPDWLEAIVEVLHLADRMHHRPAELSGGQQQRVAVARALVTRPDIVFADEPAGNLDSRAGTELLAFLREAVDRFGQSLVLVTHDPNAAALSDRVLFMADGSVTGEINAPSIEAILDRARTGA